MGRIIGGRYELIAEIASGGMATVHLARQSGAAGFARFVAVKRLHERFARDPEFVGMFLDEARLVARVRHPNVAQTIDTVLETDQGGGGELFIVMEYIHGEALVALTKKRAGEAVPVKLAASVIAGALYGLHEAHEAVSETGMPLGIVHRDVSPHNILVGVDGVARMLDFGVAKASERMTTTIEGHLKGKLSYMAPEQVEQQEIDRRTDIYAAGVVLWELLVGQKLVQGPNEAMILHQIISGESTRRTPRMLNPEIPEAIDVVTMRALARSPRDRFSTAREMAIAIENAISPVASVAEVGAWVKRTCERELDNKARIIQAIEVKASSRNLQEAVDSLRSLSHRPSSGSGAPGASGSSSGSFGPPPTLASGPYSSAPPYASPSGAPPQIVLPPPAQVPAISAPPPRSIPVPTAPESQRKNNSGLTWMILGGGLALSIGAIVIAIAFLVKKPSDPLRVVSPAASSLASAALATPSSSSSAKTCPDDMAAIPGGRFFMGSDDDLPAEKPAHNVTLRAYCMDRREVSTDAYRECSDRGDCKRAGETNRWDSITSKEAKTYDPLCNIRAADRGTHPINCVDWAMADRFCKVNGKRLPTEAEWEFAARGSDGRKFPWGDAAPTSKHLNACGGECVKWLKKHAATTDGFLYPDDDGWPTTAPIGSFPSGKSRWGIEDIVGNVWEWVSDWYGSYVADDQNEPAGPPDGKARVIRGGAWNGSYADWVRPTFRFQSHPETRSHGIGFRCAKPL